MNLCFGDVLYDIVHCSGNKTTIFNSSVILFGTLMYKAQPIFILCSEEALRNGMNVGEQESFLGFRVVKTI